MRVFGFPSFARGLAEQCAGNVPRQCGNAIPVQFDENGNAYFQYLVSDRFPGSEPVPGGCRANAAPCTVVVRVFDGDAHGQIQTVFLDTVPPPGRIDVTPSAGSPSTARR